MQKLLGSTSVFLRGHFTAEENELGSALWGIMHEVTKDVAECIGIDHRIVEDCFLRMLPLQEMKRIDWETRASNFWVCDGILQGDTSAWEISDAMESYIHRDVPQQLPICCSSYSKITNVPSEATSFFVAHTVLPVGMFQHSGSSSSLRVLHVSFCTQFCIASLPLLQ